MGGPTGHIGPLSIFIWPQKQFLNVFNIVVFELGFWSMTNLMQYNQNPTGWRESDMQHTQFTDCCLAIIADK